jgi:hypothetical protein
MARIGVPRTSRSVSSRFSVFSRAPGPPVLAAGPPPRAWGKPLQAIIEFGSDMASYRAKEATKRSRLDGDTDAAS